MARLSYGTKGLDRAQAPAGSFSFEEIYNSLLPHLKQGVVDNPQTMAVGLIFGSSGKGFYVEDKELMRKLMHGLRDKTIPFYFSINSPSFEELFKTRPLVPGDEPKQFIYDYNEEEQDVAWEWAPSEEVDEYGGRFIRSEPPTIDENWQETQTNATNILMKNQGQSIK